MKTDKTIYPEYTKDNEIHDLKNIISSLETKIEKLEKQFAISGVGSSLPDLAECNQASLDYATKKDNPDFFLIKQTFKEGINWALNYVTKNK
jgi:hypothetical protein